jgi:hypothetical protein
MLGHLLIMLKSDRYECKQTGVNLKNEESLDGYTIRPRFF